MSDSAEAIFPDAAPAAESPEVIEQPAEPAPAIEAAPVAEVLEPVTPPPAVVPEPTDRHVPITALLDEREKRQAAEREAERLRASIPQTPVQMADPYVDPQGFRQQLREEFQSEFRQALNAERLNTSYRVASVRHGPEAVEQARTWAIERAQNDPAFSASLEVQSDPVDWIVHQHKRDGLLTQIGDKSLDDFVKEYVAKDPAKYGLTAPVAATAQPAVIAQPAVRAAVPPRSIASDATAPAAASDPSADFMAIFKR